VQQDKKEAAVFSKKGGKD